jgi:hypothetical protein
MGQAQKRRKIGAKEANEFLISSTVFIHVFSKQFEYQPTPLTHIDVPTVKYFLINSFKKVLCKLKKSMLRKFRRWRPPNDCNSL